MYFICLKKSFFSFFLCITNLWPHVTEPFILIVYEIWHIGVRVTYLLLTDTYAARRRQQRNT